MDKYIGGNIRNLIPHFIAEKIRSADNNGTINATVIFIDISGFTKMTGELMKQGKEGAEVLADSINTIFTKAIDIIYISGGFVSIFGGDAFYAIFTDKNDNSEKHVRRALNSSVEVIEIFKKYGQQNTRFGKFMLNSTVGISTGQVQWRILSSKKGKAYYFKGQAIDNSSLCESNADEGEIIFDRRVKDILINSPDIIFERKFKSYYLLRSLEKLNYKKNKIVHVKKDEQKLFFPDNILDLNIPGEFREVISCFISFSEDRNLKKNIKYIMDSSELYGGYFNRISFGDKGGFLLILFGAPKAEEKPHLRACEFALDLMKLKDFNFHIGMTYSKAFTGFVGSKDRAEYTAQGEYVNLAARFMSSAKSGVVLIDENIYKKVNIFYNITCIGKKNFKGFEKKIEVFQLHSKITDKKEKVNEKTFFGRERELQYLSEYTKRLKESSFAGIIYIDGTAGIGKSRLLSKFREIIESENYTWFKMSCDEILKTSFNPIISFLKDYFNQKVNFSFSDNLKIFEKIYTDNIERIQNIDIKEELLRIKPFIGALIELRWDNSLYEKLDSKMRYENTLYGLKSFIKAESSVKPLIIELEDGHWADSDTAEFLKILSINIDRQPIAIITTCRLLDDGNYVKFDLGKTIENRIELHPLDKNISQKIISEILNSKNIPKKTVSLIMKKSGGNPFYIEQITMYLKENKIFDEDFNIKSEDFDIPSDINSIIVARIDRLTFQLKEVIKTASVLGMEFATKLLKSMLEGFPVDKNLISGEKEKIWDKISELNYLFKHALIRESVYQMQLKENLRKLHRLAAITIEKIYYSSIEHHYSELSNHYIKAGVEQKAIEYTKKAAKYARDNYKNDEAFKFYTELLTLNIDDKDRSNVLLNKAKILKDKGNIDDSLSEAQKSNDLAEIIDDKNLILKVLNLLTYINIDLGNLEKAKEMMDRGLKISKNINSLKAQASIFRNLGLYYHFLNNDHKALRYFQKALEISRKLNLSLDIAYDLNRIAIFCGYIIGLEKVLDYLLKALDISEREGDLKGIAIINANIGLTYMEVYLNAEKALEYYEKSLKIDKRIGRKASMLITMNNTGSIYFFRGKEEKALKYFEESLNMAIEIGNIINMANPLANISVYYSRKGNFKSAEEYIDRAINILKDHGIEAFQYQFKIEKLELLIKFNKLDEAEKLNNEIIEQHSNETGHKFRFKKSKAQIEYKKGMEKIALNILEELLSENLEKRLRGDVLYILWELTEEKTYRRKALKIYEDLCTNIGKNYKDFSYLERFNELKM